MENIPPEQWKAKLHEAINLILATSASMLPPSYVLKISTGLTPHRWSFCGIS